MVAVTTKHSGHEQPRPRSAAVVNDIVAQLSDLGYRDTEPRRLVISAIAAQGLPLTAKEPCASLPCVGRDSVYLGLRLLVEYGQVCRTLLEDHELRYEPSQQGHHHHPLCAVCGASADLEECRAEDMLREASADAGFRMSGHWLEVYAQRGEFGED